MRTYYTIEYNRNSKKWVLWKNIRFERGECCSGIFRGNKKECEEKLKEIKEKIKKDEYRRKNTL